MSLNAREPDPLPNDSKPIWELVVADMIERDQNGRARYGTPLQAFNGRNALVDAYQEVLRDLKWWVHRAMTFPYLFPVELTLDRLREVEARLTEEHRLSYWLELSKGPPETGYWRLIHASAEQKLAALATVLRPVVEGGSDA